MNAKQADVFKRRFRPRHTSGKIPSAFPDFLTREEEDGALKLGKILEMVLMGNKCERTL
jgi:hypothetical protein